MFKFAKSVALAGIALLLTASRGLDALTLGEDAAQSLGATRHGRPASARADAVVVSFTSGKPLDASEGGAVR